MEVETYYSASSNAGNLHVRSLGVGSSYMKPPLPLPDGTAVVFDRVGVGTIAPQAQLHVEGTFYVEGGDGDVSGDNDLTDSKDRVPIVQYLEGKSGLSVGQYARADVNGDGKINWIDAQILENVLGRPSEQQKLTAEDRVIGKRASDQALSVALNGNIGIGTVDPQARLHVVSDPSNRSILFLPGADTTNNVTVPNPEIRVGVGTLIPQAMLEVNGSSYLFGGSGDVNRDNKFDILAIIRYLNGSSLAEDRYSRADINGDGRVNSLDVLLILDFRDGNITLDQAHHDVGKAVSDRTFHVDVNGNLGVGIQTPQPDPSPANGVATGNLDVNDAFIRGVSNGQGRWLSQMRGGINQGFWYNGQGRPTIPVGKLVMLVGSARIGTTLTTVSWPDTPFKRIRAVFLNLTTPPTGGSPPRPEVSSVLGEVINNGEGIGASSFRARLRSQPAQDCYFVVVGEANR